MKTYIIRVYTWIEKLILGGKMQELILKKIIIEIKVKYAIIIACVLFALNLLYWPKDKIIKNNNFIFFLIKYKEIWEEKRYILYIS